jgi:hypothetical protein
MLRQDVPPGALPGGALGGEGWGCRENLAGVIGRKPISPEHRQFPERLHREIYRLC